MSYPSELESWWLDFACSATGEADHVEALRRLEGIAAGLSDAFTVARPGVFTDYTSDPLALASYGIFFFPQTFARVGFVMIECLERGLFSDKSVPLNILDLGCGPGASLLSAAGLLRGRKLKLHAVDHAVKSLAALKQLFADCKELWPGAELETLVGDIRNQEPPGSFDLILASFVLNEMFPEDEDSKAAEWVKIQLQRLPPGGCFVILEPAGAGTCGRLQRLRDIVAADPSYSILAPCCHHRRCPVELGDPSFCHDVRSWPVPDSVNLINRRMFRSVHHLKYGLLAVQRAPAAAKSVEDEAALVLRLVGPVSREKGRLAARGCCADGTLRKIEVLTRGLSRQQVDVLTALERGDRLRMLRPRLLGDGRLWRADAWELNV